MQNEMDFYEFCNEFEYNHDFVIFYCLELITLQFKKSIP